MGVTQGSQEKEYLYFNFKKEKKTLKSTFYPRLHGLYLTSANVP